MFSIATVVSKVVNFANDKGRFKKEKRKNASQTRGQLSRVFVFSPLPAKSVS